MLSALSCKKAETDVIVDGDRITFAPYIPYTKALIDNLNSLGNQIIVYDYMVKDNSAGWYIDGVNVSYDNTGKWDYVTADGSDLEFLWLDESSHSFFGWLDMDNALFSLDGKFDQGSRRLSIPTIDFTAITPQYDFLYSEVHERYYSKTGDSASAGGSNGKNSEVNLQMKHLFSAFRFNIQNYRDAAIIINSIRLDNICTQKFATIDFWYPVTAEYTTIGEKVTFNSKVEYPVTLSPSGGAVNAFNTDDQFLLIWPQSEQEFTETDKEAAVILSYTQKGITKDKVLKLKDFGHTEWEAGKRYSYTITFTDKEIVLTCSVNPWEGVEDDIDFTETVTIKDKMVWNRDTVKPYDELHVFNPTTGEVIVKQNGDPAVCTFEIDTPSGAVWNASLILVDGHIGAFEFDGPSSGPVGRPATLKIKATNSAPYAPIHRCILRITVRTGDGRTIVVNNLPPTGSPFHEFVIVQEPI